MAFMSVVAHSRVRLANRFDCKQKTQQQLLLVKREDLKIIGCTVVVQSSTTGSTYDADQ